MKDSHLLFFASFPGALGFGSKGEELKLSKCGLVRPAKRTPADRLAMSQKCQQRTHAVQQRRRQCPGHQRQPKPLVGPSSSERESFAAARPHHRSPKGLAFV